MKVFFLIGNHSAFERFVRREVSFPEGMPSMYLPWLRYKKRGYDVHVFMLGKFRSTDIVLFGGCMIHLIPRSLFSRLLARILGKWIGSFVRLFFDNIRLYRCASRNARQVPPTIVNSVTPWYAYAARLLKNRYDCCSVKRIYGTFLYYELMHNTGYMEKQARVLEKASWRLPCDMTIITNDGTHGDKVAALLGLKKEEYRFWFNGIDRNNSVNGPEVEALRNEIGLSRHDFVLLCLSRLSAWKRQDRVIRAMELIIRDLPNARLVIAGDGRCRADLTELVTDLGLTAFVKFLGMVAHEKVPKFVSIADVFLQTNDYTCLTNTLLEAMACGRTIVTWDVGGTSQVITDGETGCLLPDPEPSTIAKAVISLAKDPEKAQRLGRNARRFTEERLQTWDERLDMEIDLVEGLCS